ncbi:MAG: SDR family oxidoreductase [Alistipes sp.]|nr:SDR family oxidoreductase [Alistipes sp.]
MKDKLMHGLKNPQTIYPHTQFPMQKQDPPGIQADMDPVPDCGEESYIGHGRLEGRRALITGGDSGIGRAVAIAFAREGARVAINYLEEEQRDARSLAELLGAEAKEIILIPGDLRREEACERIVRQAHEELGGLDLLVPNAAGQTAPEDIRDITGEQVRRTFETNIFAPIFLCRTAVPLLPAGSSIIFTGSAEYYTPNRFLLDYAASKSALVAFGIGLAKQVIDKGIRVNTVCPGPVWTPLEVSGGNPDEWIPNHGLDTPFKRPGQPVEMAGVYVFLASNEATYVSGEIYGVTGLLSAH